MCEHGRASYKAIGSYEKTYGLIYFFSAISTILLKVILGF